MIAPALLAGLAALILGSGAGSSATQSPGGPAGRAKATEAYGKLALRFEANRGQTDSRVDFLARGPGYGLFLTPREAVLSLSKAAPERGRAERHRSAVLRMRLAGANPGRRPAGVDRLPGATNYLRGANSGSSQTAIPGFAKVRYRDVYPGVDLLYYGGGQGRFEYDFTVAPGADPGRIALDFSGQRKLALDRHGDLLLNTGAGTIRHRKPFVYQEAAGTRRTVAARFVLERGRVGFRLGAYDRTRPLTIDPVVVYATYLGGISTDLGTAVAADGAGNAYVTGMTSSPNFPTAGPIRGAPNLESDAFVAKLSPSGSLAYSTYLGGAGDDTGADIAVDAAGAAYVTGRTGSTDFPTTSGAADTSCGATSSCGDAFLAKLAPSGAGLTYSTYVGGDGAEAADGVAVDASGAAYVGGSTSSTNFPTQNPFQATYGGGPSDGFVTKVNAAGSAVVYSTYLGGSGAPSESVAGIEVDSSGSAYATGTTGSPDFATTAGAFDTSCGSDGACGDSPDAFVTKLSAGGAALDYSTFLGTAGFDRGYAIAVGQEGPDAGRAYVLGTAGADLQTTPGAYDRTSGGGFVARLNASGSGLEYSTFLGGATLSNGDDSKPGIAVDPAGSAYVSGATGEQAAPPQLRPVAESGPGGFAAKLDSDGSGFAWSTFLGGAGSGMALDPAGAAYVTGHTGATDFPTQNPLQRKRSNGDQFTIQDGFVVKLAPDDPQAPDVTGVTPEGDDAAGGRAVRITGTGFAGASAVAFGGVAATRFDVVSPTEIEAIAPPHGESDLRVTVTSAGRTSPPNPVARFVYAEGRWAKTDALPGDPAGSATLLRDGKVLFLSGTTARLYDPLTGTWAPTEGPTLAGTPTLLPSGRVLVHAGAKAVRYDPATGASTATRGAPKTSGGAGTLLESGEILVVGGETAELYDPATDGFRLTGGPTFSSPDTFTRLKNGKLLVAGGEGGRAELYDPATGAFSETGRLNIGRVGSTATLLLSGKVLVAGGFAGGTAQETAELYDPATGAWRLTRSLDQGRYRHAATLLPNGKVLIAGGVTPYDATDAAELHDPALGGGNGSFKPAGRTEASYSRPTATVLSSDANGFASDAGVCGSNCGKVLVVGSSTTGAASLYAPRALPAPAAASPGATPPASAGATPPPPADAASPLSQAATLAGCPARTANAIRGTARGDAIVGTPRGDRVFSLAGPDTVDGRAGDDCIDLGAGSDRGVGGVGDDLLLGATGSDRLSGGRGRDRIRGAAGNDLLRGSSGGDHLTGGAGRDSIAGGAGNDRIEARDRQRDRIACGSGADTVIADRIDRVARDCERVRRS